MNLSRRQDEDDLPLPVRYQVLSAFRPFWPRQQAVSLTRTYSRSRPPQRDKPLSQTFVFFQSVNLRFLTLHQARAARCGRGRKARPSGCVVAPVSPR